MCYLLKESLAMLSTTRCAWLLALAGLTLGGCNQNPFLTPQQQTALQQQQTNYQSQAQELQRRVSELDVSNRDLHTRLAQSEQQQQISHDQTQLLQQQLRDTANQLKETQLARQDAEKSVQMLQASTRKQGGAMITANNSVRQALATIDIPGVDVRQDQDVIRIELPADELFQAGTVQLVASAYAYLDKVAEAIARNYPRQRIAIEGHTDSAPTFNGTTTTNHQLSCLQALAVFDILTRRNHLPSRQLFVMGLGANHPRASNATDAGRAKNRRIELVIYPQTLD
jgi:flagellar motor protein MotB